MTNQASGKPSTEKNAEGEKLDWDSSVKSVLVRYERSYSHNMCANC